MTDYSNSKLNNITKDATPVLDSSAILETFERLADDFCADLKKESVSDLSQNQFTALCIYINHNFIRPNQKYLTKSDKYIDTPNSYFRSNNNAYDFEKLNIIFDVYIYITNKYDKVPTVHAFLDLVGVSTSQFYAWRQGTNLNVSRNGMEFIKRVLQNEESGLSDILISGKRNIVGVIEQLNVKHGHSAGILRQEENARAALPASALPILGDPATIRQIEQQDAAKE